MEIVARLEARLCDSLRIAIVFSYDAIMHCIRDFSFWSTSIAEIDCHWYGLRKMRFFILVL